MTNEMAQTLAQDYNTEALNQIRDHAILAIRLLESQENNKDAEAFRALRDAIDRIKELQG